MCFFGALLKGSLNYLQGLLKGFFSGLFEEILSRFGYGFLLSVASLAVLSMLSLIRDPFKVE